MGSEEVKRFGLSLKKDGGYAMLTLFSSMGLSFFFFGLVINQQIFTAVWKKEYGHG